MLPKGNELEGTMVTLVVVSEVEARALTERIRVATTDLAGMLREAHEREAWKVLGYRSWNAYIDGEFDFSTNRSYRLLAAAHVEQEVSVALGQRVHVKERPARGLVEHTGAVVALAKEEIKAGAKPQAAVNAALKAVRAALPKPKAKRRGPPSLAGWLQQIRAQLERIDDACENAGEDALDYLTAEDRREFERTVTKTTEWSERWGERLSAPRRPVRIDEFQSA